MMKTIVIAVLLVFLTVSVSQAIESHQQARAMADRMMNHFVKQEFDEGLALVKAHWPLPEVEIDNLANQIKTQWPIIDQRFGQTTGQEFIREERIGHSFVRYYYLHKFQNHAIYWKITFFRPVDEWKVNGVVFVDTLEPLYEVVN